MSEEDKFDEIIRSKFSEKKFLFDEENWEKAEAMIDSVRRRKSAVKWSAVFLFGLFAGIALMLPFVGTNNKTSVKENENIVSQQKIQIEEKELPNSNKIGLSQNVTPACRQAGRGSPALRTYRDVLDTIPRSAGSTRTDKTPSLRKSFKNQKTAAEIYLPGKQINKKELKETKAANVSAQNISNITEVSEKKMADNISALVPIVDSFGKEYPGTDSMFQGDTSSVQFQSIDKISVPQTEIKNDSVNLALASVSPTSAKDSVSDSSAVVSQNNSAEPPPMQGLARLNIFSVDAGANYGMGWSYNDTTEGRGFNPVFGLGITHYFNQTGSLYFGIQYGSIANMKASQKIFSSKTYDFGYNSVDTIVDTKSLYYVVFPVQFHYHFNNNNSIGIGGSVLYLVNTKSDVVVHTMAGGSTLTTASQKTEMGYYAGTFRQWDASMGVVYRRKISEKLSVSASVNYGLLDIKNNAFFLREKFERNIGFTLTLSYNLFDF